MRNEGELKLALINPMLVMIGLVVVAAIATIKVVLWRGAHGRPQWAANIVYLDLGFVAIIIVAWVAFVARRRAVFLAKR